MKLDNHRQLKLNEIIRKGDFFKSLDGSGKPVQASIGNTPATYNGRLTFWRRKHTKKVVPQLQIVSIKSVAKKPVAKYPTVNFSYNGRTREVQVIKMDDKYISGLEVGRGRDKIHYQFKKFLRSRIHAIILMALADKQ